MKKVLLVGIMCLCCTFSLVKAASFAPDSVVIRIFDDVLFYDGYNSNIFDKDLDDGVLRHSNSLYAVRLGDQQLSQIGDSLRLDVSLRACCDNYDRIANINLALVPKGSDTYSIKSEQVQRLELGRFITPFMNKNKTPDVVPYKFDVNYLSHIFHDSNLISRYDFWFELEIFGVPYAANKEIAGCEGRSDVFFGTLELVSSRTHSPNDSDNYLKTFAVQKYMNNYQSSATDRLGKTEMAFTLTLDEPLSDGHFVLVTSNHGANSGGEEYVRRVHYVFINEQMALVYRPGRSSCEPFRKYNTQSNGIYGASQMSDESWQSFSNWCPGDVIDNRIISMGEMQPGEYTFRIMVPDAEFVDSQGYFPVSLFFQGLRKGKFEQPLNARAQQRVEISWKGEALSLESLEKIESWSLCDSWGNLLRQGNRNTLANVDMSGLNKGVYVLLVGFDDELMESHKVVKN